MSAVKSLRLDDSRHIAVTPRAAATATDTRTVLVPGQGRIALPVYSLGEMAKGDFAKGPAILEEDYFTARVPAGWAFVVSDAGDVILDREG